MLGVHYTTQYDESISFWGRGLFNIAAFVSRHVDILGRDHLTLVLLKGAVNDALVYV